MNSTKTLYFATFPQVKIKFSNLITVHDIWSKLLLIYTVSLGLSEVQGNGSKRTDISKFLHLGIVHELQSDQKVSVHLIITVQEVTRTVQSVPRQSPDIY
jgi:hypothetical protein